MIIQENNYSDRDLKQNWNEKNNERKKVICLRRYYHWTVKKMHGGKVLDSVEEEVLTNFLGALVQNTGFILYVTVSSITQVLPPSYFLRVAHGKRGVAQKCSNADNVKGLTSL